MKWLAVFALSIGLLNSSLSLAAQSFTSAEAQIESIDSIETLSALTGNHDFYVGESLSVLTKSREREIVAFVEIISIENLQDGRFRLRARLIRQSKKYFVQIGDTLIRLDLSVEQPYYLGNTDLAFRKDQEGYSARYKPLVFMGLGAGETAQTLNENEVLLNFIGYMDYGISEQLQVGSFVPANFFSNPNFQGKYKLIESESNVASVGLNYVWTPENKTSVINMSLFWDSVSSESVISHTNLSLALASFEGALDVTAVKGLGTSSIQTGYEFILKNWDRVLVGPSYNFEKKAVGGYLTYTWIWDHVHLLSGISATDITEFKMDVEDGYYINFDVYWRF